MARTTHRGAALLVEAATALQLAVKLSLGCKLQDEVNARRVVEVAVEAQDVWVPLVDRGTSARTSKRHFSMGT